ncbi:Kinesin-like protein KIF21B [Gracilariopsis chorda]|uniref:Kinesin-like protein KIF21B n=1 Tax=Gracilariopsis chorda TaxID=448386 RepID=A0A2V3IKP3_9FLOR|nr:Kinesin-like protein KIF21B [Gracilariopsis chorda]|eukprot:PXF42623.1 Kinesin-like protein KIF21B [Gracilariopsis chorda]
MTESKRKQAALWTVGRGSRGLLRCSDRRRKLVIAGTAVTNDENAIHILSVDNDEISLTPLNVLTTPSEVWSLEVVGKDSNLHLVAATRKGYRSAVEVWSLMRADDLSPRASQPSEWGSSEYEAAPIRNTSFLAIDGDILKVVKNPSDSSSYMALTKKSAVFLTVGISLKIGVASSLESTKLLLMSETDSLVDAGWIDENTAYVASTRCLGICDTRTGTLGSVIETDKAISSYCKSGDGLQVPSHPTRISTSLAIGGDQVVVGGEDGSLRCYECKTSNVVWQVSNAHTQWVSTLCETQGGGFLSGGMDGVVRCWRKDGQPVATFPQHDDIVTNACSFDNAFVTVSYDGRIALNELPVAT